MSSIAIEDGLKIAVLIPCQNQAATIGAVVRGFADALPSAEVYVFDNNSTDDTARAATREGARVYRETRQGKSNVVRRMFADIDADIYLLAAGDGSTEPADAPSLVNALITEHVDMVVGTRDGGAATQSAFGAQTFERLYGHLFGGGSTDILSGYRAFTRRFVRSFPSIRSGFDVEVELSIHASELMIPVAEIELTRRPEQAAPTSMQRDLARMLRMSAMLVKETRPFIFYSMFAVVFWAIGLALMLPFARAEPLQSIDPSVTSAALGMAMFVAGFVLGACGLILDSLGRARTEQKRILFLTVPALGAQ